MAREDNLILFTSDQDREKARENGRKGGIASGEAKRKKKAMKEPIELMLSLPLKDEKANAYLDYLGISEEDRDNQMGIVVSMYKEAVANGSVQAATFIRDTIGENPKERVEVEGTINTINPLEGLSTEEIREAIEKMKKDENNE